MSIIYEALQKTQRNRQNKLNNDKFVNAEIVTRRFDLFDLILISIIMCLLSAVVYLYHSHFSVKTPAKPIPSATVASNEVPTVQVTEAVSTPQLTLNGVLVSDADKIALINNQPLHTGDTISGMKIVSIELNEVVLQQGTQRLVLHNPI